MNNVVSLKDWKLEHPDRVIVSILYSRTVINITSEDRRTTYKSHVQKYPHTQVQFDTILKNFLDEYPTAKIVGINMLPEKE